MSISPLKDDDEMLQGVDWTEVREKLDMHKELNAALSEEQPFIDWLAPFRWCGDSFKAMRERLTSGDCLRGGTGMTPEEREKNLHVMRDMHRASALHDIHRASALREIHRASAIQERAPYFSQNPARTQGGNQEGSGLILIIGESDNASRRKGFAAWGATGAAGPLSGHAHVLQSAPPRPAAAVQ